MLAFASCDGLHKPGEIERLADIGFTHLTSLGVKADRPWERELAEAKRCGIQVVARWPNYADLGLCGDEFSFQAWDGRRNNTDFPQEYGRLAGPSHWHPAGVERAVESLEGLAEIGLDAVGIHATFSDRWYPTDWYPFGDVHYSTAYWCFDPHARAAWAALGIGQDKMMHRPPAGYPNEDELYQCRWYQQAWWDKLTALSDAAMVAGMKTQILWHIPLNDWTDENMADGTADAISGIEAWQSRVKAAGGDPIIVNTVVFGLWERWERPATAFMADMNHNHDWKSICGTGAGLSVETCVENVLASGRRALALGYQGIRGTDWTLLRRQAEAKWAFGQLAKEWERVQGGIPE